MTKGLFTSTEEIKFQKVYSAPLLGTNRTEKFKPLFTSLEEIKFQNAFVNGHIDPVKDSLMARRDIRQDNRLIAQNLKRINHGKVHNVWRER